MKNKIAHPVLIIWFAIAALFFFSFAKLPVIPYLNHYTKIDILQDIKAAPVPVAKAKQKPAPGAKDTYKAGDIFDSALIQDYADDPTTMMSSFYAKLKDLAVNKGRVRIAYFGDSYIEGDLITGTLRRKLQHAYGGDGVGFLPMQSIIADDYTTIKFERNTSWADYNFRSNPQQHALGLTGHLFYSNGNASSQYEPLYNNTFNNIYLFTGRLTDSTANADITVEKDDVEEKITVNNNAYINRTVLNEGAPLTKLKIVVNNKNLPVYGISMEDSSGLYIDNYGFRGNTGLSTLQLTPEVMEGFNNYFAYDLIILHYGLNVVSHSDTNYQWFEKGMHNLIQKLRSSYPGVPILLVSTSDVAYNDAGEYKTDPAVPLLVSRQNAIARNNKTAFWNLYYAMGGEGTIAKWATGDTILAYKDYMHVNEKGAEKIGSIFYNKLLQSQKK